MDCHASHLFSVIRLQGHSTILVAFETALLRNNEEIRVEHNAAVFKPVKEIMMDKQADFAICLAARETLEWELFFWDIHQLIVEDSTMVKSLPTPNHAKRHVDKALEDGRGTHGLTKSIVKFSNRWEDVATSAK